MSNAAGADGSAAEWGGYFDQYPKDTDRPPPRVISPNPAGRSLLGQLIHGRDILFMLFRRDMVARYRQTALGLVWLVLQPLLNIGVMCVFFGWFAKMPSNGLHYPTFLGTGFVPWILFSSGIFRCTSSLLWNDALVKNSPISRVIIPASALLSASLDFTAYLLVLLLIIGIGGHWNWNLLFFSPLVALVTMLAAVGLGLATSVLNVYRRDVQGIVEYLMQVGFFATPVLYPSSLVPQSVRRFYYLNPLAGVIDGFRWAVGADTTLSVSGSLTSLAASLVLFGLGVWIFRALAPGCADAL